MHVDSGFLISGGPEPQAGADWLLTIFAPDGELGRQVVAEGDHLLRLAGPQDDVREVRDEANKDYPEIADSYKSIANSTIMPVVVGASYPATQTKIWPWMERFWAGEISDKEAVTGAMKEIQEEIQKSVRS